MARSHPLPSPDREAPSRPGTLRRSLPLWTAAAILTLAAFGAWNLTPLREQTTGGGLLHLIETARHLRFAPLWALAAYMAGAIVLVPITLLVVITIAVYPNLLGIFIVAAGTALNCETGYGLGRLLGARVVRRYFRESYEALSSQLRQVTVWKLFVIRFFPITPFASMNVVCGTAGVAQIPFLISGVAGVLPGAVLLTVLQRAFGAFSAGNSGRALTALGLAMFTLITVPFALRYALRRRRSR